MSPDPHRHSVTAVVVAHDGSRWLPDVLQALRSQTRQPDHVVAVDNDSRDRSAGLLQEELGTDRVLNLPRDTGFGGAVGRAVQSTGAVSATGALEMAGSGGAEWIWLLHDDSAPAPDALERLLEAADEYRYAAVLGPKLRDWMDRRVLLEAGITIDGGCRRETGLEPKEFDQGQHDGVHEVLAVSTAGMLVRRDVWDALGGLAPELPLFRDDVDFGWRVNASGHRVLAVTSAVAYHAEAATRRRRRLSAVRAHPRRLDRRNALFVLLVNLPPKLAAWAVVRNLFGGVVRALVFLLAKQPGNSWDEIRAYASVVGNPIPLLRARRRRRGGPRRSYHTLEKLMPPRWQGLRRFADMVIGFFSSQGPVEAGRHHAAGSISAEAEEEPLAPQGSLAGRLLREPGVVLFLALTAVTLLAERSLLGGGRLGGGALLPVSGGAGDLWGQYLSGWHATGLGSDAPSPPYVAVVALLATILLGKTWLAVDVLLLGAVPLAGTTAYVATRQLTADTRVRVWAAATYALLPVATGAVASGRFGTAVALVLVPLIASLSARMLSASRRQASRAAWGVGGLLGVTAAFVPLAWALAAVLAGVASRYWGGSHPGLRRRLLIVLAVPLILLMPWTLRLFAHPGLFLREAGLPAPDLLTALDPARLLLLQPGGPGMPPLWTAVGLMTLAVIALAWRARRAVTIAGWTLLLCGLLAAIAVSRFTVTTPSESSGAAGWPGVCLGLAGAGAIVAASMGAEWVLTRLRADKPSVSPMPSPTADGMPGSVPESAPESASASAPETARETGRQPLRGGLRRGTRRPDRRERGGGNRSQVARASRRRRLRVLDWHYWAALGLSGAACFTPVVAAGFWVYTGADGPLDRNNPPLLPAFVAAQNGSEAHPRALVLRGAGGGQISYAVLRDGAPPLGSAKTPAPPGLTDRVSSVVAGLASGRHAGEVAELASYGIRFVVLPSPFSEELVRTLDANPQLSRTTRLSDLAVWRLKPPAARMRVLPGAGEGQGAQEEDPQSKPLASGVVGARVQLPAGPSGRELMLAESAHPGWQAALNGVPLQPTTVDRWAQGFQLPSAAGELVVSYSSPRGLWVLAQASLALVVLIMALPGGAATQEEEEPALSRRERRERRQRRRSRTTPRRARGHRAQRAQPAAEDLPDTAQPRRGRRG